MEMRLKGMGLKLDPDPEGVLAVASCTSGSASFAGNAKLSAFAEGGSDAQPSICANARPKRPIITNRADARIESRPQLDLAQAQNLSKPIFSMSQAFTGYVAKARKV
jgi:hypothetical protein